jgi:uncharacterized protein YccT (UPF0319 family)
MSFTVWAAALTVSENIVVIAVNDKIVDHGMLGTKSSFSLNNGLNALTIHYKDVFEDLDFGEDRVVLSKDFVVNFTITKEQQLKLKTPAIRTLDQAESFSKSPRILVTDEFNKALKIELENVSDHKIAQQVDIAVKSYTTQQTTRTIEKNNNTTLKASSSVPVNNTLKQVQSLTMLKYWWQNASAEEKKHFKQYILVTKGK